MNVTTKILQARWYYKKHLVLTINLAKYINYINIHVLNAHKCLLLLAYQLFMKTKKLLFLKSCTFEVIEYSKLIKITLISNLKLIGLLVRLYYNKSPYFILQWYKSFPMYPKYNYIQRVQTSAVFFYIQLFDSKTWLNRYTFTDNFRYMIKVVF